MAGSEDAYLVYEDRAAYDAWLKWLLAVTLGVTLVPAIVLFPYEPVGAWVLLGTTAFDALLFHAILPRRYQILSDRLKIVLGRPFAINIALTSIREARPAGGMVTMVYWGVRLATSARTVVEIVRYRGLDFVISPAHREEFLTHLKQAMAGASAR